MICSVPVKRFIAVSALLFAGWGAASAQEEGVGFREALQQGTPTLYMRLSQEQSDLEGNGTKAATALTVVTRLGYRTKKFGETSAYLQFQNLTALIDRAALYDDSYDTAGPPEATTVHQAYLDYTGLSDTLVRVGRQKIQLDDSRLITKSKWRQNGRAFDSTLLTTEAIPNWRFTAAYFWMMTNPKIQRLPFDHFVFLRTGYEGIDGQDLSIHGLWLDSPGGTSTDRDMATYGVRATGDTPDWKYIFDYNTQTGYADNAQDGGSLLNVFAAGKPGGVTTGLGYTEISGEENGRRAFDILFGSSHKFNGYSDQFGKIRFGRLVRGLKETQIHFSGTAHGHYWQFRIHRFIQQTQSQPYGNEANIVVSRGIVANLTGLIKVARYVADPANDSGIADKDETVYWARLAYSF